MQKNISHTVFLALWLLFGMASAEAAQRALIIGDNVYPSFRLSNGWSGPSTMPVRSPTRCEGSATTRGSKDATGA